MELGRKDVMFALAAFTLAVPSGYYMMDALQDAPQTGEQKFSTEISRTVNASRGVIEVSFDNRTVELLHSDLAKGAFFFDTDEDPQTEREVAVTRDGKVHQTRILLTVRGNTYIFHLRYADDPATTGDAWMEIYRIEET
ncbi:MAG: hypothetical protein ABEK01_01090 [Candidatus Nanohaloarchaea archaeon]